MAVRILPGFMSLSEFGAYHGDCGECATLGVLHALDPEHYPLTLTELNHLTSDAIAHGEADASLSGGMNIPHLDAMLTRLGVPHRTVGYGTFNRDTFHADLKAHAGIHGIIAEWSTGGALPGDEAGVKFHYSSFGGVDNGPAGDGTGGAYLACDGDNRASSKSDGGSAPIRYTWSDITAASPIGYIIVLGVTAMSWTIHRDAQGNITGATCDNGDTCAAGMAALLTRLAGGLDTHSTTHPGEVYYASGKSFLTLDNGEALFWHAGADVVALPNAAGLVADLWGLFGQAVGKASDLAKQLQTAQAALAAAQANQGDPHAQAVGAAFLSVMAAVSGNK